MKTRCVLPVSAMSFAHVAYMWNNAADYLIFDYVIWDEFEDLGYPSKESFFTQVGSVNVCKPEHTSTLSSSIFIGGNLLGNRRYHQCKTASYRSDY